MQSQNNIISWFLESKQFLKKANYTPVIIFLPICFLLLKFPFFEFYSKILTLAYCLFVVQVALVFKFIWNVFAHYRVENTFKTMARKSDDFAGDFMAFRSWLATSNEIELKRNRFLWETIHHFMPEIPIDTNSTAVSLRTPVPHCCYSCSAEKDVLLDEITLEDRRYADQKGNFYPLKKDFVICRNCARYRNRLQKNIKSRSSNDMLLGGWIVALAMSITVQVIIISQNVTPYPFVAIMISFTHLLFSLAIERKVVANVFNKDHFITIGFLEADIENIHKKDRDQYAKIFIESTNKQYLEMFGNNIDNHKKYISSLRLEYCQSEIPLEELEKPVPIDAVVSYDVQNSKITRKFREIDQSFLQRNDPKVLEDNQETRKRKEFPVAKNFNALLKKMLFWLFRFAPLILIIVCLYLKDVNFQKLFTSYQESSYPFSGYLKMWLDYFRMYAKSIIPLKGIDRSIALVVAALILVVLHLWPLNTVFLRKFIPLAFVVLFLYWINIDFKRLFTKNIDNLYSPAIYFGMWGDYLAICQHKMMFLGDKLSLVAVIIMALFLLFLHVFPWLYLFGRIFSSEQEKYEYCMDFHLNCQENYQYSPLCYCNLNKTSFYSFLLLKLPVVIIAVELLINKEYLTYFCLASICVWLIFAFGMISPLLRKSIATGLYSFFLLPFAPAFITSFTNSLFNVGGIVGKKHITTTSTVSEYDHITKTWHTRTVESTTTENVTNEKLAENQSKLLRKKLELDFGCDGQQGWVAFHKTFNLVFYTSVIIFLVYKYYQF